MASEWKEKAGGDDFDDEGLPLLRKHTQVRPASLAPVPVSYTHLTLPTTPYV